jgi:putative DNA primase/helicase
VTKPNDSDRAIARTVNLFTNFGWTDSGNAERLVFLHGGGLRFVRAWGRWLSWSGGRWTDDTGAVFRAAKATARAMLSEAARIDDDKRRAAAVAFATKSESRGAIEAMVSLARHETAVAVAHERLDADRMLLNCANGTVDLRTGKLRPHRPEDLITKLAPVAYDENAGCPVWDAFLSHVMGRDAEMVSYLQRLSGYTLTGDIREHILAFFLGKGRNGKSTYLRTLHGILGDYASPAPRGLLFRARGERHPTEFASLHGRRFVTCSEVEEGQAFDEPLVKDLTGGDPVECRRMREDFWSFEPTHKLFIAGNHKPTVRGDDEGIWRRMRLVPWLVTIAENEQDKGLTDKLLAEAPGILAWAVRGCIEWQTNGLGEPSMVRSATNAYREENDALGEFFRLRVVFDIDAAIARKDIREAYESHCKDNGSEPFGAKRFAGRLREQGVKETSVRRGSSVVDGWRGVRLATDAERAASAVWANRDVGLSSGPIPYSAANTPRGAAIPETPSTSPDGPTDDQEGFAEWVERQGIGVAP